MNRGGQKDCAWQQRRLDGLFELYIDGLPGKMQSTTGLPEMLRWILHKDHPALTQASLKQLQRVTQGSRQNVSYLDRYLSWLKKRFNVPENVLIKIKDLIAKNTLIEYSRIVSLVHYLQRIEGLEDDNVIQFMSLLGVIETHLERSCQLENIVAISPRQRIDDVMFLRWCTSRISYAVALVCEMPGQTTFGAYPWLPKVTKDGGLRSSRYVFVEYTLRKRARKLGCESMVRQDWANVIAKAAYPDDASGNAADNVKRAIPELLGKRRLDGTSALHKPAPLSLDMLCTYLQYPSRSHALGIILRTMEMVDQVQRELLVDGMSADAIVKEFDASVYRVAINFEREMIEQVRRNQKPNSTKLYTKEA